MLKQIAWNTFKNTGDINTFIEMTKVEKAMKDVTENKENRLLNLDTNEESTKIDRAIKL